MRKQERERERRKGGGWREELLEAGGDGRLKACEYGGLQVFVGLAGGGGNIDKGRLFQSLPVTGMKD